MRTASVSVTLLCLFLSSSALAAQNDALTDGTIVEQKPCPKPDRSYDQYVQSVQHRQAMEMQDAKREGFNPPLPKNLSQVVLTFEDFQHRTAYAEFECQRVTYLSDGLRVRGFLWKPRDTAGKKFPVIIFNRGGNREFGKLMPWSAFGFHTYVSSGFVVVASQYRGNDGGEGREEFGGADVRDVLNLIPLIRSLGYADTQNVFMLGWSRGGMMTYMALKHDIAVNAVAVGGGLTDLLSEAKRRPQLVRLWKQLIPEFDVRGEELLRERSVVFWPDKVSAPVLILHGSADWRADPTSQAQALAESLTKLGKKHQLVIYLGDDHGLTVHGADGERRIIEWFKKHSR